MQIRESRRAGLIKYRPSVPDRMQSGYLGVRQALCSSLAQFKRVSDSAGGNGDKI